MNVDAYRLALSEAGKLKLRASALLAEGGRERAIDAAVLFQAAARAEARSLLALERVPIETRLAAAIEECWCLLEGGDPPSAALAWDRVRAASEQVAPEVASSMRSRLDPIYAARTRAYAKAIQRCKTLTKLRPTGSFVPPTRGQRALLDRELSRLLQDFPGVASFWWARYRLAEVDGDTERAWAALRVAYRLQPQHARFAAMSLLLAARTRPLKVADELLGAVDAAIDGAAPEVALLYAFAQIELARRVPQHRGRRFAKAIRATEAGLAGGPREGLRRHLLAARLLVSELAAGREATVDILYRAGLGDLAASMLLAKRLDLGHLLEQRVQTEIEADERLAA
jgi:hypothetical protein